MHRLPENMFLLSLRQNHCSNSRRKVLRPTPSFLYFENSDIFNQIQKKRPYQHLWWLVSEARMYRLQQNMLVLSLQQDHCGTLTIINLGPTPQQ